MVRMSSLGTVACIFSLGVAAPPCFWETHYQIMLRESHVSQTSHRHEKLLVKELTLFVDLFSVHVSAQACDMCACGRYRTACKSQVAPHSVGTELRMSGLVASTLASVPTCLQPYSRLKEEIIYCASGFHKLQSLDLLLLFTWWRRISQQTKHGTDRQMDRWYSCGRWEADSKEGTWEQNETHFLMPGAISSKIRHFLK